MHKTLCNQHAWVWSISNLPREVSAPTNRSFKPSSHPYFIVHKIGSYLVLLYRSLRAWHNSERRVRLVLGMLLESLLHGFNTTS